MLGQQHAETNKTESNTNPNINNCPAEWSSPHQIQQRQPYCTAAKRTPRKKMSRGFCLPFPSETLIIDCVAFAGSKALSVKAPLDSRLHGAHRRYSEARGCGIIHDPERSTPSVLTLTGLKHSCFVQYVCILGGSRFRGRSLLFKIKK